MMLKERSVWSCLLACVLSWQAAKAITTRANAADPVTANAVTADQLRERVDRALRLVEKSSAEYLRQRECFSCHHQAMSIMTLIEARERGLTVDQDNLAKQVERTIEHLRRGEERYKQGEGQGGRVDTAGYALLGLAVAGYPADHTTDIVVEYLLQANATSKHWVCSSDRPPTETSDVTTSTLALKGLAAFAPVAQAARAEQRRADCQAWLADYVPVDNEERVFYLLAAKSLGKTETVAAMRDAILAQQRDDGGWSQKADMSSDAYATGTALYALVQAGYQTTESAYQRGLQYLSDSQLPDGSWHVATRSSPIQKYFESGFPHGVDQFISMAATCWSTLAMLHALPKDPVHVAALPKLPWLAADDKKQIDTEPSTGQAAAEPTAEELEFFERDIRPLLVENCAGCHGVEEQSGGLRVDSLEALLAGGDSGPALVPRKADRSLMIKAVRRQDELKMPPDDPLRDSDVAKLEHWIKIGAPWPKGQQAAPDARKAAAEKHWAFQPVSQPDVPEVTSADWAAGPEDRFILSKLEHHELAPATAAERQVWLRRLSYDLAGLPPSAEQLAEFATDTRPDAYERVVDRMLASPKFGEQWARHWLDVARYSDTKGYVYAREERFFVHAPAYRDWVISALGDDMPYDRFVELQLAADQVAPDDREAQAAMGFLTVGRRFLGVTHDIIDDRIDVVTRGLLGLTVGCARCHDHKFDPIPTADYYAFYGVFHNSIEQRVRIRPRADEQSLTGDAHKQAIEEFEAELAKREQAYRDRLAEERKAASQRVRERLTDYLLAQLELDKYPAEGFDVIIASDDLVPAHVRRFQAYFLEAAERNDPVLEVWRRYQALPANEFESAAVSLTAQLAELPSDRVNPLVARAFANPAKSMQEVARRYGELFAKLDKLELHDATERAAADQLRSFLDGPNAPCNVPDEQIVSIEQFFPSSVCEALWKLQGEVDRWINGSPHAPPFATVLVDRAQIREPHIFRRGNPKQVGARVTRQFLSVLCAPNEASSQANTQGAGEKLGLNSVRTHNETSRSKLTSVMASGARSERLKLEPFQHGSGRRELASAIVDPRNPLTSRVWTNRIWQHLFGQGLVDTPSDFGLRADAPSHPELLDWMASDYVAAGQSTKRLIRRLVLSATYRQSSAGPADEDVRRRAAELDPDNRWLWHASPKRLTFEQQRDSWLQIAGELDFKRGGRAAPLFDGGAENRRRTIYGLIDRQFLPGVLRVFDFANPDLHTPQRSETTVPQQALFGLNHPFTAAMARGVAAISQASERKPSVEQRVESMYRTVLSRAPDAIELAQARQFLEQPAGQEPPVRPEAAAWQYGYGELDVSAGAVKGFTPLPHFSGNAWQGGPQWPDAKLGWAQLTANGGHAGNDLQHAAVRRWTATRDGTVQIRSSAKHEVAVGDGIRCSIVASRGGVLKSSVVHNEQIEFHIEAHPVQKGDTIDFVTDFNANLNSDQFLWAPSLSLTIVDDDADDADNSITGAESNIKKDPSASLLTHWQADRDFAGPAPKYLDPWEQLAQVLLLSNELMFID